MVDWGPLFHLLLHGLYGKAHPFQSILNNYYQKDLSPSQIWYYFSTSCPEWLRTRSKLLGITSTTFLVSLPSVLVYTLGSIHIIWEHVRHANSQAPIPNLLNQKLQGRAQQSVLWQALQVLLNHWPSQWMSRMSSRCFLEGWKIYLYFKAKFKCPVSKISPDCISPGWRLLFFNIFIYISHCWVFKKIFLNINTFLLI